jgi:hypothetical protein
MTPIFINENELIARLKALKLLKSNEQACDNPSQKYIDDLTSTIENIEWSLKYAS